MESTTPTSTPEKSERRLSKAGRAAAFVGAGALGATILTGVAFAAGNNEASPNPAASSVAPQQGPMNGGRMGDRDGDRGPGGPGGRGGHGPGFGMGAGPGGELLHGEAVVKDANGKIQTVRTVEGTVTAVTGDSITVKAADGFTQTFVVNSSTTYHRPPANLGQNQGQRPDPSKDTGKLSDIKVGDVADITGTVGGNGSGSTVTATHVRSMTAAQAKQFEQLRKQHEAQEQQERQQNQQANPSSSATPGA